MALSIKTETEASQGAATYADHLESHPVQVLVSVEKKAGKDGWAGKPTETEVVVPGLYSSNGMRVTVEGSHTVNMGNYESAKIGVSLTVPCSPDSLNDAYDFALAWCGARIQAEVASAKGQ